MSLTKINPRGQITIPAKFRSALNCKPGDYVEVQMEGNILTSKSRRRSRVRTSPGKI